MPEPITHAALIERGFHDGYRRHYRDFVIDALERIPDIGWNLELRAGSLAFRHELQVETLEELDTLLRCIDRKNQPRYLEETHGTDRRP